MKNFTVDQDRMDDFVDCLARLAAGDFSMRMPISLERDELDAISFGINMLAGEIELHARKRDEALRVAERAGRAKSDFIAAMSHELRTPLTALVLGAELLEIEQDPEQRNKSLKSIQAGAATLVKLVEDLLDLSKIEADRLEIRLRHLLPETVVSEVALSLRGLALAKRIRLELKLGEGRVEVQTDPLRLKQILLNLIGNAIKFTGEDGVIKISVLRSSAVSIAIEVEDSGIGIPAAEREKLFQPFFRAAGKAKSIPGTGLGLAVSRRLAERLGAELELAWSEEGRGSCFRLRVPQVKETTGPALDTSSPGTPASRPTRADNR